VEIGGNEPVHGRALARCGADLEALLPIRGPHAVDLAPVGQHGLAARRETVEREASVGAHREERTSRSRWLGTKAVGQEHAAIAERVRAALAALRAAGDAGNRVELARARKLREFFGQPFFCAEPYTKRPGSRVSRADALRACREILDGAHDDLPLEAFRFNGSIEEIRAAAPRA
jgi:hypothetical protein